MYRELLSEGIYNNATEYAQFLTFAEEEFEEEVIKEVYEHKYFEQVENNSKTLSELTKTII